MWAIYAFLSAIAAAAVAILGSKGLKGIDSTLATTIRALVMAGFMMLVSIGLGRWSGAALASFSASSWWYIVSSGVAGAVSWLFYFYALKNGPATQVAVIDRLSLVFVAILATLFLGEKQTTNSTIGIIFIVIGALLATVFKNGFKL